VCGPLQHHTPDSKARYDEGLNRATCRTPSVSAPTRSCFHSGSPMFWWSGGLVFSAVSWCFTRLSSAL
jgi:hypothetical protein